MTLGDALTQVRETSVASVEELHTLAGGADIKVSCHCLLIISLDKYVLFSTASYWNCLGIQYFAD